MSRSRRHTRGIDEPRNFKKNARKIKPYTKDTKRGKGKFLPDVTVNMNVGTAKRLTKAAKLEAKNANRSLKKGARQEGKKQMKSQVDQFLSSKDFDFLS